MKNWSWKIISSQTYYKATVIKTMCYLLKSPATRSSIDFFFLPWNVIVYINVVCVSGGFILFHWQSSKQNLFISIRNIERDKKAEYGPSVVPLLPPSLWRGRVRSSRSSSARRELKANWGSMRLCFKTKREQGRRVGKIQWEGENCDLQRQQFAALVLRSGGFSLTCSLSPW